MHPHFRTAAGLFTVHNDPSISPIRRRFNHQLDHDDDMGNFTAADERFEPLVVVSTAFNEEAPRPGKVSELSVLFSLFCFFLFSILGTLLFYLVLFPLVLPPRVLLLQVLVSSTKCKRNHPMMLAFFWPRVSLPERPWGPHNSLLGSKAAPGPLLGASWLALICVGVSLKPLRRSWAAL